MITVEEALAAILATVKPLPAETVLLSEALGRTLAEDVDADIDTPPFDNSAVDGYAVRAADTEGAGPERPVSLRALADLPAGAQAEETVLPGTAVRIMTGAPLPPGADAVVMVEDTLSPTPDSDPEGRVLILATADPNQHVRRAGEDMLRGARALNAGALIRPAETAMLAAMGRSRVRVTRQARVAVFSTGDEVVEIEEGVAPPPGKIRNSNRYALGAMVLESGALLHSSGHLPDDPGQILEALRAAADPRGGADMIVTAGGVSMGDRDYVRPALERLGALELWKVAMKPGKPLAFGVIGETLCFGLPGNPVSALVTFELFVRPALRKMAGRRAADLSRPEVRALLSEPVRHTPGRREYLRAVTTLREGHFVTTPTGAQGSGILHSMTLANSLLIVPTEVESLTVGSEVAVLWLT